MKIYDFNDLKRKKHEEDNKKHIINGVNNLIQSLLNKGLSNNEVIQLLLDIINNKVQLKEVDPKSDLTLKQIQLALYYIISH